jgi:hypothetical protein
VAGARQNELVQLQSEVTNEISRDAPAIANMVFGDNKNHPDMAQVTNQRLDDVYRQAFAKDDREFLQNEAKRDPEQFLKVADRIGVKMPDPNAPPAPAPPAMPPPMVPPPALPMMPPVPPVAPVAPPMPMVPPSPAAAPGIAVPPFSIPPPPMQGGPAPQIVGPNGMPLA